MDEGSFEKKILSRREVLGVLGAAAVVPEAAAAQKSPEPIPAAESIITKEEVRAVLRELVGDTPYEVTRDRSDADGLYLFEVKMPEQDGFVEYEYSRGRPEKGQSSLRVIVITFYNTAGIPTHGHNVAKKVDGEWKLTPYTPGR